MKLKKVIGLEKLWHDFITMIPFSEYIYATGKYAMVCENGEYILKKNMKKSTHYIDLHPYVQQFI